MSDTEDNSTVMVEHTDVAAVVSGKGGPAGIDPLSPMSLGTDASMISSSPPDLRDEDSGDDVLVDKKGLPTPAAAAAAATAATSSSSAKPNATSADEAGEALQIVSIGSEESEYAFHFDEDKLNSVLKQIPPGWKVSVVSVVGAFRTGKSFLLSWFLRYLRNQPSKQQQKDGGKPPSGAKAPWYKSFSSLGNDGFEWKAGSERNTTGIWMWSQPFFVDVPTSSTPLAVLLVDTQGMFDHETTMSLTASIFGFSTLLSSYQIYNVDKRIQEDNLQHLALFSEYARAAVIADDRDHPDRDASQRPEKEEQQQEGDKAAVAEAAEQRLKEAKERKGAEGGDKEEKDGPAPKPFQKIEFLVRDWQHFGEDDDDEDEENIDGMERGMTTYLNKVIADRDPKDLQETREQINACFDEVTCFGLCHPGFAVTKKKYTGSVSDIEDLFLRLLDRYCSERVFSPDTLEPKRIHGRDLTAVEFLAYVRAYAELFSTGAKFPEASTLLDATVTANNTSALELGLEAYKSAMDRLAGLSCSNYMRPNELETEHRLIREQSVRVFDSVATFGNDKSIEKYRKQLVQQVHKQFETYRSLNDSRNPLLGLETYLIPFTVGIVSMMLRWFTDLTCTPYSDICRAGSDFFSHVYYVVLIFMFIIVMTKFKQIQEFIERMKKAFELMSPQQGGGASQHPPGKVKSD